MNRYSRVYPVKGENRSGFRYNYAQNALERVSKHDSFYNASGMPISLHFID